MKSGKSGKKHANTRERERHKRAAAFYSVEIDYSIYRLFFFKVRRAEDFEGTKARAKPRDKKWRGFCRLFSPAPRGEKKKTKTKTTKDLVGKNNYNYIYKKERTRCLNRA